MGKGGSPSGRPARGRKRPPGRWDSPPKTGGTGRGTPHRGPTTGNCMLAKAIGATVLVYLAGMAGLTAWGAFA